MGFWNRLLKSPLFNPTPTKSAAPKSTVPGPAIPPSQAASQSARSLAVEPARRKHASKDDTESGPREVAADPRAEVGPRFKAGDPVVFESVPSDGWVAEDDKGRAYTLSASAVFGYMQEWEDKAWVEEVLPQTGPGQQYRVKFVGGVPNQEVIVFHVNVAERHLRLNKR